MDNNLSTQSYDSNSSTTCDSLNETKDPNALVRKKQTSPSEKSSTILDFNTSHQVETNEGTNDLIGLPIELLQKELIKRGYKKKVIEKLPKWYLVALLHELEDFFDNGNNFNGKKIPKTRIFTDSPENEINKLDEEIMKMNKKENQNGSSDNFSDYPQLKKISIRTKKIQL